MRKEDEDVYIVWYMKLLYSVCVRLAERIVKLIRHFYSAPFLQILGYVVLFLQDEVLSSENHHVVEQLICCLRSQTSETDHGIASEIAKKQLPVPSYTGYTNILLLSRKSDI